VWSKTQSGHAVQRGVSCNTTCWHRAAAALENIPHLFTLDDWEWQITKVQREHSLSDLLEKFKPVIKLSLSLDSATIIL